MSPSPSPAPQIPPSLASPALREQIGGWGSDAWGRVGCGSWRFLGDIRAEKGSGPKR